MSKISLKRPEMPLISIFMPILKNTFNISKVCPKNLIICLILTFLYTSVCWAETGLASYYTFESCQQEGSSGYYTASGERYNENDLTCALPHRNFGGLYKVTNLKTSRSIVVKHNDLGPAQRLVKKGRIIDLSKKAFWLLSDGRLDKGILKVSVNKIKGDPK